MEKETGREKEGKPFSLPRITILHFLLLCLQFFFPIAIQHLELSKKEKGKVPLPWQQLIKEKSAALCTTKACFGWGIDCNVGQLITSLPFFLVSDIPWDSSLSSQALALFLSCFI